MQDAVQAPQLVADGLGDGFEIRIGGRGQVHRKNRRLRSARRHDLVVDLFQLVHRAPQQHHRGAMAGIGQGRGTADAAGGAGDENDMVLQEVGGGGIGHGEFSMLRF